MILKILKILRSPFPLLDIKFMIMQQRFVFKLSVLVTLQNKISRIYYWIRIDFLLNVMIFQGQFLKPIINIRLFFSKVSAFFSISSYFRLFMHRFSFSISLVSLSLSLSPLSSFESYFLHSKHNNASSFRTFSTPIHRRDSMKTEWARSYRCFHYTF